MGQVQDDLSAVLDTMVDKIMEPLTKEFVSWPLKKRYEALQQMIERACKLYDVRLAASTSNGLTVIDGAQHNHDTDELLFDPVYQVELGVIKSAGYTGGALERSSDGLPGTT